MKIRFKVLKQLVMIIQIPTVGIAITRKSNVKTFVFVFPGERKTPFQLDLKNVVTSWTWVVRASDMDGKKVCPIIVIA